jgi:hypothetical protein
VGERVLLAVLVIAFLLALFLQIRVSWVAQARLRWMKEDVGDMTVRAPTFRTMMWKFWIWNPDKFYKRKAFQLYMLRKGP